MALDEYLVKNDCRRGEGWGREPEPSGPDRGEPWVLAWGVKDTYSAPVHLPSLASDREDQPEDP